MSDVHKDAQSANHAIEHHCDGMLMEALDEGEDVNSRVESIAVGSDTVKPLSDSMQDCDYLCQIYRGVTSLDPTDSMFILSSLLLRDGDGYLNRFVTSPIEVHFRPPITA